MSKSIPVVVLSIDKKLGIKITGITNGIDSEKYLPEKKEISLLPYEYSPGKCQLEGKYANRQYFLEHYASRNACLDEYPEIRKYGFISTTNESEKTVYVSYHGRIVSQKGIDILQKAAVLLLEENLNIRFIFMGQGEQFLEKALAGISERYTGRCVYLLGYERALTRLCTAAADFAVFPSNFEPCGLEDFIAQIYGTLPVAHATGGLCKIIDEVKEIIDAAIKHVDKKNMGHFMDMLLGRRYDDEDNIILSEKDFIF
mgnify:CR=1 FL=1